VELENCAEHRPTPKSHDRRLLSGIPGFNNRSICRWTVSESGSVFRKPESQLGLSDFTAARPRMVR